MVHVILQFEINYLFCWKWSFFIPLSTIDFCLDFYSHRMHNDTTRNYTHKIK